MFHFGGYAGFLRGSMAGTLSPFSGGVVPSVLPYHPRSPPTVRSVVQLRFLQAEGETDSHGDLAASPESTNFTTRIPAGENSREAVFIASTLIAWLALALTTQISYYL